MQNIECKYKIVSPAKVQQRLASRADIHPKFRHFQKDIYFKVVQGRLKIRIENGFVPCLIEYYRDDGTAPRRSDYSLTPLPDYEKSLKELKNSYGILAEVEKWRELYLYKNVRIHLDDVMNLGYFLEFESVISDEVNEQTARHNLNELLENLGNLIGEAQSYSYVDLLLKHQNWQR